MSPPRFIYFGNWVFLFVLGFLKVGQLSVYNYRNLHVCISTLLL